MKLPAVAQLVTEAILAERERCARVAIDVRDGWALSNDPAWNAADEIASGILSASPPVIKMVRPETVEKDPSILKPGVIVAGVALAKDDHTILEGTARTMSRKIKAESA